MSRPSLSSPPIRLAPNHMTFLVGLTGSGKTHLARAMCARESRFLVLDTKLRPEWPEETVLESYPEFLRWACHLPRLRRFRVAARTGLWSTDPAELQHQVDKLFEIVLRSGRLTVAVEELHRWCGSRWISPHLELVLREGRSLSITTLATDQRIVGVHPIVRTQCAQLVYWRTIDGDDAARLHGWAGGKPEADPTTLSFEDREAVLVDIHRGEVSRLNLKE